MTRSTTKIFIMIIFTLTVCSLNLTVQAQLIRTASEEDRVVNL